MSSSTPPQPGSMALLWPDLALLLVACAWALGVAALLAWVNLQLHLALFAWSFWFIFPVGAILCGFVAGLGYSAGARLVRRKPGLLAGSSVYVVTAMGYLAIYYFEYRSMEFRGVRVSSLLPFRDFLDAVIRGTRIGINFGPSSGSIGAMGYPLWVLHLAGYVFGGVGASVAASAGVACDRCRRFLVTHSATAYGPVVAQAFPAVRDLVRQGQGAVAVEAVRAISEPESDVRLRVEVSTCATCARELYEVTVSQFSRAAVGYVPLGQESPSPERWRKVTGMSAAGAVALAPQAVPVPVFGTSLDANADRGSERAEF